MDSDRIQEDTRRIQASLGRLVSNLKIKEDKEFSKCRRCGVESLIVEMSAGVCHSCVADLKKCVPSFWFNITFDKFKPSEYTQEAYEASKKWYSEDTGSILIVGNSGRGKSHLCIASYMDALRHLKKCKYINVPTTLRHITKINNFETKEEADNRMINDILSKDLVYLDDLIPESINSPFLEMLYTIFEGAINNGRPRFFMTSNKGLSYISEHISDRIASRIGGLLSNDFKIDDKEPDHRLIKK